MKFRYRLRKWGINKDGEPRYYLQKMNKNVVLHSISLNLEDVYRRVNAKKDKMVNDSPKEATQIIREKGAQELLCEPPKMLSESEKMKRDIDKLWETTK